jgi:predicted ATPase
MALANQVFWLAKEQDDPALMMGARRALAVSLFCVGDFQNARQHAVQSIQIWRSGGGYDFIQEVDAPPVTCLTTRALCEWHSGDVDSCNASIAEAIALAKELHNMQALAQAIYYAGIVAHFDGHIAEVDRSASELIDLSAQHNFVTWLPLGFIHKGWARAASGDAFKGFAWIDEGIEDYRKRGSSLGLPYFFSLKAETLHSMGRISEAHETIKDAQEMAEKFGIRWWYPELLRLRSVFLANLGAGDTKVESSFCAAIDCAKKQNSISLLQRAKATCAQYRRQKASGSGGKGIRLPLFPNYRPKSNVI